MVKLGNCWRTSSGTAGCWPTGVCTARQHPAGAAPRSAEQDWLTRPRATIRAEIADCARTTPAAASARRRLRLTRNAPWPAVPAEASRTGKPHRRSRPEITSGIREGHCSKRTDHLQYRGRTNLPIISSTWNSKKALKKILIAQRSATAGLEEGASNTVAECPRYPGSSSGTLTPSNSDWRSHLGGNEHAARTLQSDESRLPSRLLSAQFEPGSVLL